MSDHGNSEQLQERKTRRTGATSRRVVVLAGHWQVLPVAQFKTEYSKSEHWLEMELPSHWQEHPSLDSYTGKLLYKKEFTYRKKPDRRYWLHLPGIFYWSRVHLNRQFLGSHEGYFSPQEYEVSELLSEKNILLVEVDCPAEEANHKRMVLGVFSGGELLDPQANPGGMWLPVEIRETGAIYIKNTLLHTERVSADRAEIQTRLYLDTSLSQEVEVHIAFIPHNFRGNRQVFSQKVNLSPGVNEIKFPLGIAEPQLWWTHDLGHPSLYRVSVDVARDQEVEDRWSALFGIRTFEMRDWIAYLNGQRIFLKGSNYPPGDLRLARMNYAAYQKDLELARAAHFNILRVKAHIEHPDFYRAADEAGLLLWQDFPLQGSYQKEVLSSALKQAEAIVRRLFNHPSLAIWCMHDHPVDGGKSATELATLKTGLVNRVYSWNRDVLDTRLKKVVEALDRGRYVVRSSGEETFFLREGTDSQFSFGWERSQGPLNRFQEFIHRHPQRLRFVTGFGAQSFPNYETAIRFMDPELSGVDWKHLEERHGLQKKNMAHWVNPAAIKTLEELIATSQEHQMRVLQYYIDRLRYHKYRPTGGMLTSLFLDPNPAVQSSLLDYWRVPKKSYWALQRAFHPQYVFTFLEAEPYRVGEAIRLPIYIVNDFPQDFGSVEVTVQVREDNEDSGLKASIAATLSADCLASQIGEVSLRFTSPGRRHLLLTLLNAGQAFQNEYLLDIR